MVTLFYAGFECQVLDWVVGNTRMIGSLGNDTSVDKYSPHLLKAVIVIVV